MAIQFEISDALLAGIFPVVWWLVELTKKAKNHPNPKINWIGKIAPTIWSVALNIAVVTAYIYMPDGLRDYIKTVALPVGMAALFHEGRKIATNMTLPKVTIPMRQPEAGDSSMTVRTEPSPDSTGGGTVTVSPDPSTPITPANENTSEVVSGV